MTYNNSELGRFYGMDRKTIAAYRKSPNVHIKRKLEALEMFYGMSKNSVQLQSGDIGKLQAISQQLSDALKEMGPNDES